MSRNFLAASLVVALFAGLALVFVWYLSFGMGRPSSSDARIATMNQDATLSYRRDGAVAISAESELDAYRALGFQAGHDHAWTVALLRQTAIGRLGEWFGDSVLRLDAFARHLGFGASARDAAAQLSPEDARALAAYAEGMSSAFEDRGVSLGNEFVLFDIHAEPWEPWHSLAIERMIAWLSEPPLSPVPGDTAFWEIKNIEEADRRFRSWLHVHGADMSAAWAWSDSAETAFAARFVYGATTLPLFSAVSLQWPQVDVSGIVLLGTPFLPIVSGPVGTRIALISSRRQYEEIRVDATSDLLRERHERIKDRFGDEALVSVMTYGDVILARPPEFTPGSDSIQSATALRWAGFRPISDWPSWRATVLAVGSGSPDNVGATTFRLVDGNGLVLTRGDMTITGDPVVRRTFPGRVFVANNAAAAYAADRVGEADVDLLHVATEDTSAWARENAPRALAIVGDQPESPPAVKEALEYLRNWDFRYDVSSIGAAIFDGWMLHFRDRPGTYPVIAIPDDSLGRAQLRTRLRESLVSAVDSLVDLAGPDLARWRLEYLRRGARYFPVWSYPPLHDDLPALNRSRYAPIEIPQSGHPTTLAWQPGLDDDPASSPSHVLATGLVGRPQSLFVRPDYDIGTGFIARYIAGPPEPQTAAGDDVVNEIILRPGS